MGSWNPMSRKGVFETDAAMCQYMKERPRNDSIYLGDSDDMNIFSNDAR